MSSLLCLANFVRASLGVFSLTLVNGYVMSCCFRNSFCFDYANLYAWYLTGVRMPLSSYTFTWNFPFVFYLPLLYHILTFLSSFPIHHHVLPSNLCSSLPLAHNENRQFCLLCEPGCYSLSSGHHNFITRSMLLPRSVLYLYLVMLAELQ